MHGMAPRLLKLVALLLAAGLVVSIPLLPALGAPGDDTTADIRIGHFMAGLACVESGGRYHAENPRSGAYGKYQIMPGNWPRWARRYLGFRDAEQTPPNQEFVARARIKRLYEERGSWRRVAYWWLTGENTRNEDRWTDRARGYVDRVMAYAEMAASPRRSARVPERCFPREFEGMGPDAPRPKAWVRVKGGSVFVRRGPSPERRIVGIVRRDTVLPVLDRVRAGRDRHWLSVRLRNGRIGWVAGWYTRPAD